MCAIHKPWWTGWTAVGVIALWGLGVFPVRAQETTANPGARIDYQERGRRDPFFQPETGRLRQALEQVDIENLKLTGIIRDANRSAAIFVARTGPHFGYILKHDRLFGENHQAVPGISGTVRNPKEVLLRQDDRELVYQLTAETNQE
jgi:hypothetical protein